MKIFIDIGHPGHVHFFKNFIWEMEKRGHEFKITARDKEITQFLLKKYDIDFIPVGKPGNGKFGLIREWLIREYSILKIAHKFQPDLLMGIGNPVVAHVSKIIGKKSIIFTDTEHAKFANGITFPFADFIFTPSCFKKNLGKKQIRYASYHELAYLHPKYFTPNPSVLNDLGLSIKDIIIIIRLISWEASHDIGQYGIQDKIRLLRSLEQYGRILITSEGEIPPEMQIYKIPVSPEKLHDLLNYATLYVGEGGTTSSEAAVLGTPAIFVSSLVGTMGNFTELEETYDLLYGYIDSNLALTKAKEILENSANKEKWNVKREKLLNDKIDITAYMIWLIDNYPQSIIDLKKHRKISVDWDDQVYNKK